MTRLWHWAGRFLTKPAASFSAVAARWPASTAISTTVVKTAAADLFAQKVIEGKEQIDWKRNSVFSSFGFAYLGLWQYYLYAGIFPKIATRIVTVFGERAVPSALTFLDQCVHHPILYFPSFYLLRGYVGGETAELSMAKCREDLWTNLKALWVIWVPTQYINFKVVPGHLRVPFVAAVSAVWCVIMSVFRGESASVAQHDEVERLRELVTATAVAAAAAEAAKEERPSEESKRAAADTLAAATAAAHALQSADGAARVRSPAPDASISAPSLEGVNSQQLPQQHQLQQQHQHQHQQQPQQQPQQPQQQQQEHVLPESCMPYPVCRSSYV